MKTRQVEFTPPAGAVPEGTTSGEEFDMVCTFRVKDSGTICLVELGETKMPGYDTSDSKPTYESYSKPMTEAPMQ